MQMYKNRNGNSKQSRVAFIGFTLTHTLTSTATHTYIHTYAHTYTYPLTPSLFLTYTHYLATQAFMGTNTRLRFSHFRKDSSCVREWPVVCPSLWRTQSVTDRQMVQIHSQCVWKPRRGWSHPTFSSKVSQCTQESAVKYQGETVTHTHTHTGDRFRWCVDTHIFSYYWQGGQNSHSQTHTHRKKRCVTCLWKSVRTAE